MASKKQGNGARQSSADSRGVARLAQQAAEGTLLYETKNPLPVETRARAVELLNHRLADCIVAHAVTNGLLAIYVLYAGHWQYWL